MRTKLAVGFLVVFLTGCHAIRQQKGLGPAPAPPSSSEFKNLRVLNPSSREELIGWMRGYTRALGVQCAHCHVEQPGNEENKFDFASDAKPTKEIARVMIRMTRDINGEHLGQLAEKRTTVTCMTCHRGQAVPDTTTSLSQQPS